MMEINTSPVTQIERLGTESFRLLKVLLAPGQKLIVEPGAMASMEAQLQVETLINQGFFQATLLKFLGGESFFINYFLNPDQKPRHVFLSQSTPGEIIERDLKEEKLYVQPGALIARTSQVQVQVVWAGIASWIGGEGLFRLELSGSGRIWYGCYGAMIEKEVLGDYIVDSGHLLSYPPEMKLSLKLAGSLFSSLLTREGIVLKLSGHGKIQLQTRSIKGLAQWLNPRFWG
ncbi:MAG TPA: TIGR00266 family protein [Pseudobdellovibrionaceae bacterium]|nr:TIGR00266 family protein [Pseudobdellovibrionaceae bacterium]